jgi:hypothetical protein
MAGEIARQYEEAVQRMMPGYAAHPDRSTSDAALMGSLAVYLPFRTNRPLRNYAHTQLANLRRRILALRGISSPPINTRRRGRREIEPVPGDLVSQGARIEFMVDRFEEFGVSRVFANGRRMESLQYRAYFTSTSRYLNEFWRAALEAIHRHIRPLQAGRPVSIHLSLSLTPKRRSHVFLGQHHSRRRQPQRQRGLSLHNPLDPCTPRRCSSKARSIRQHHRTPRYRLHGCLVSNPSRIAQTRSRKRPAVPT